MKIPPKVKAVIPTGPEVIREALIVLGGVLIAAYIISRFPALKNMVRESSITVDDSQGNNYW